MYVAYILLGKKRFFYIHFYYDLKGDLWFYDAKEKKFVFD